MTFKRPLVGSLVVAAQIGLLGLLAYRYRLEHYAFTHHLMPLVLGGFVVHSLLPPRARLPFFALLSAAAAWAVLGPHTAAWLLGVGLALIAICRLPLGLPFRAAAILGIGLLLALARADVIPSPAPAAMWPLLGSMFMFRMVLYLHALKHSKQPGGWWHAVSYFFMLPNPAFPLFPVVDYDAMRRTHHDQPDPYRIYQTGIDWMARGVVQLVLYRLVSYRLTLSPEDIVNAGDLLRYLMANFLLYLRISGQFHLIIGILHLFGFNLPETNQRYLLAASFTDFWRRINIYWKDFMLKVFYYPAYFQLRKRGATFGMVVSTLLVFVVTWFLHSYQWFWLRGSFLFTPQDVSFWGILAVLVLYNTLREARHGRARSLTKRRATFKEGAVKGLRTTGTFLAVCVLWSLWTSSSFEEWLLLWPALRVAPAGGSFIVPALILGAIFAAGSGWITLSAPRWQAGMPRRAAAQGAFLVLLWIVSRPAIGPRLGEGFYLFLDSLTQDELSARDLQLLERGYYEDLVGVNRFNSDLWRLYAGGTDWETIRDSDAGLLTGDFLELELRPSASIEFKGVPLTTNRWGMRDKDYEKAPAPGTLRIALLGSSHTMGSGVADDETFETLVEDRVNRERAAAAGPFEILNFSVDGYALIHELQLLERRALDFQPDVAAFVIHQHDARKCSFHLVKMIAQGVECPYPELNEITRKAGIAPGQSRMYGERQMTPYHHEVAAAVLDRIGETCREHGVRPVLVILGHTTLDWEPEEVAFWKEAAGNAGVQVLDLSDVYRGHDRRGLRIGEADRHPNPEGHRIIAGRFYEALREGGMGP